MRRPRTAGDRLPDRRRRGTRARPARPSTATWTPSAPAGRSTSATPALAADRVRELIADGVAQGRFRDVHPALIADTVTTLMFRIGRGRHRAGHRSGRRHRVSRARGAAAARHHAVKVESAAWDDPDVQRLTAAQQAEVRARYDGKGEPGTPPSAADISVVLVARDDDGVALGCGALRRSRPTRPS